MGDLPGAEWQTLAPYLVPALIILVIIRRNLRPRPLKIERMWFYPALVALAAASMLASQPPPLTPISIGVIAAALVIGVLIGWQRGRLTHITIDPESHELTSKTSVVGMVLILALFGLKFVMRMVPVTRDFPISAAVVTDASLLFAVGLMTAQRLEMWVRAQKLLTEAQAAKAARLSAGPPTPAPGPPEP